ncbi:tRNA dihydrouridine synthase DusB, partial [Candidatus Poribacteria bacterium]|nr:tRNA dihydrouridine synthase DusB [Candidatus Poribacteria bacterium]
DIIDLNFGCPAKKIVKNGSGSALMKNPKLLGAIVAEVVDAVSIPVTAKIRAGWDVDSINAVRVSQIIEDSGASAVIVHPRTRSQAFSGHSDWKIIGDVKESVSIPVIGNGDINTPEDAEEMLGLTGCDGVMIGRGAMGNPWIFSRSIQYIQTGNLPEEPADTEKVMHLLKFARELVRLKDEYTGCREIRKFVKWYTKGMPNAKDFRKKAVLVERLEQLEMLVLSYIHTYAEVVENEVC